MKRKFKRTAFVSMEILYNINVFTVTFGQFNSFLMNLKNLTNSKHFVQTNLSYITGTFD